MADDEIDVVDAYEHLAFSHKAKSRLKTSLDLQKVLEGEPVTFEVDSDNLTAELALMEDEDEDIIGQDCDSVAASFFSKKTQKAIGGPGSKNAATLEALTSTDFVSVLFVDIEKSMTSIHEKDLVKKEIIQPGSGKKVPENGKVFIHYIAICEGSDEPHDSTLARRVPEIVDMRKGDILPGLYLAIQSMELNEVSKFIVKSSLAFGEHGCQPRIPPNADILYIVQVLQIIDEQMLQTPIYMTADERALLPFKEIYDTAEQLRTDGNGHFMSGGYWNAIKKYRKGVAMLEDYPLTGAEDEEMRNKLLHTVYSNLAQCYLNLERPAQACTMCKLGMRSAEGKENVKLLYRFAKGKFLLKDYEGAIRICDQALKAEPNNSGVKDLRQKALVEDNKSSAASNKMFQGIFKK